MQHCIQYALCAHICIHFAVKFNCCTQGMWRPRRASPHISAFGRKKSKSRLCMISYHWDGLVEWLLTHTGTYMPWLVCYFGHNEMSSWYLILCKWHHHIHPFCSWLHIGVCTLAVCAVRTYASKQTRIHPFTKLVLHRVSHKGDAHSCTEITVNKWHTESNTERYISVHILVVLFLEIVSLLVFFFFWMHRR